MDESQSDALDTTSALDTALRRPQFGLRTLLTAVAACSIFLAAGRYLGAAGTILLGWFIVLAAAHVMANAWGSRASRVKASQHAGRLVGQGIRETGILLRIGEMTPTSPPDIGQFTAPRLSKNASLGSGTLAIVAVGAAVGVAGGGVLFNTISLGSPAWLGMVVGVLSSGILGGLGGFLASGFVRVGIAAAGEAVHSHNS